MRSSILIINPFGIGDVLFTTPLIRAIAQAFPQARIGYLCNRRTERILKSNPHLDAIFVYEKDDFISLWNRSKLQGLRYLITLMRQLHRFKVDSVFDLSLGDRYSLVMRLLGARCFYGFRYRRRGRFLTSGLHIDGYHYAHVIRYYKRLLQFLGIRLHDEQSEFCLTPATLQWADHWLRNNEISRTRPIIGLVPAGGVSWGTHASYRRWSMQGFASVADYLVKNFNAQIIVFGEKSDIHTCQSVIQSMQHPTIDASGQTNLEQFVGLLSKLDLVICNDGGPLHLAVSQKVKTVSLFGPVDPYVYGPYPPDPARHAMVYRKDMHCRPCYHRFRLPPCPYERACLTGIGPEEVMQACAALLKKEACV